jgi:hypothetical protein
MQRSRQRLIWIAAKVIVFVASGACAVAAVAPLWRSTDQFLPFAGDPRVRYEPGAENAAAVIARALPAALATIGRAQFRPFAKPVTIYVCASTAAFDRYGFGVTGGGGFVLNGRLFISPKPQNTAERLPRVLTHELSHLHLEQQLGLFRFALNVPNWFKEGLAVCVSGGGGAETVSETEASDALAHGRAFHPEERGHLLFPQTGAREHLPAHLFYRESGLFVAFLARRDPAAFKRLVLAVEDRREFADAVRDAYERELAALWREFVADAKPMRPLSSPPG